MRVPGHASRPATCFSNSSCITTPHQVLHKVLHIIDVAMETAARCNQTGILHPNFHTAVFQPTAHLRHPSARAAPQLPRRCAHPAASRCAHADAMRPAIHAWGTAHSHAVQALTCCSALAAPLLAAMPAHPGVISAAQPFTCPTGGQAHAGVQRPLGSTG
jgi:hypothetical protein